MKRITPKADVAAKYGIPPEALGLQATEADLVSAIADLMIFDNGTCAQSERWRWEQARLAVKAHLQRKGVQHER